MAMTPEEFYGALEHMLEPQALTYRLYHDSGGRPLFYSMEDLPGTYIEIDQATFAQGESRVQVVNGELVTLTYRTTEKLVPGDTGTQCHVNDVAVVVSEHGTHWSKRIYEQS
jgi:hypothetical protein